MPSACLRYEEMETMSKQRKPARKESERGMEEIRTHKGVGLRKRETREGLSFYSSSNPCLVFSGYEPLILATNRPLTRRVGKLIPNNLILNNRTLLIYNPSISIGSEIGKGRKSGFW